MLIFDIFGPWLLYYQWSLMLSVEKLHELDLMFSYIFFFRLLDAGSSSSSTGTLLFLKYIGVKMINQTYTGFIQASMSKIQGLFKDFSSLSNSFQGLNVNEKY